MPDPSLLIHIIVELDIYGQGLDGQTDKMDVVKKRRKL